VVEAADAVFCVSNEFNVFAGKLLRVPVAQAPLIPSMTALLIITTKGENLNVEHAITVPTCPS
jgi:hypothetical protein